MSQIEHMAIVRAELLDQPLRMGADDVGRRVEHIRVQVALQRNTVADPLAGLVDRGGPVQANGLAAGGRDLFQPLSAALGEQRDRDDLAVALVVEQFQHLLHVAQ